MAEKPGNHSYKKEDKSSDVKNEKDTAPSEGMKKLDIGDTKSKGACSKVEKKKYTRPDERVSEKTETFVNRDMEKRSVKDVPGIGPAISEKLAKGSKITQATELYDQFRDKSKEDFMKLMKEHGGNKRHQNDAYHGLKDWHDQHGDQ